MNLRLINQKKVAKKKKMKKKKKKKNQKLVIIIILILMKMKGELNGKKNVSKKNRKLREWKMILRSPKSTMRNY